ncbi:hypothetical protein CDV31_014467 [Fusarium ambrosium]|nr:hypothetical protein CDV31_014467 [Fusarium ambrosium]
MPVEPISFGVGTALAGLSLLSAFDGAVNGWNALSQVFREDTKLSYLALQCHVEAFKFESWGEHCGIKDDGQGLVYKLPPGEQETCARLVAKITQHQRVAGQKFLGQYDLEISAPEGSPKRYDEWIEALKSEKLKRPRTFWGRLRWTLSHRDEFVQLLNELVKMNQDLWDTVRPHMDEAKTPAVLSSILKGVDEICLELKANQVDQTQIAATLLDVIAKFWQDNRPKDLDQERLIERVAEGVSEKLALQEATEDPGRPSALVQRLAELRKVKQQSVAEASKQAKMISLDTLEIFSTDKDTIANPDRVFGRYDGHQGAPGPVMIEWKHVSANDTAKADIVTRIRALVTLLCSTNHSDFCRYPCLGVYFDRKYEEAMQGNQRLGLVYQLPPGSVDVPKSLLALIKGGKRPPLGDRFQLAYRLAAAMSLLHASHWIHKSFHSDNVLFNKDGDLINPYICGFQYSRPSGNTVSLESSPLENDKFKQYFHPAVSKGWSKIKDIYSLGIVLLEVALWQPLYTMYKDGLSDMSLQEVSSRIIRDIKGPLGARVEGLVGSVFLDSIRHCLEGAQCFGVNTGEAGVESQRLTSAFFDKVVEPLGSCRA